MVSEQEASIQGSLYRIQSALDDLRGSKCLDVRANVAAYIRKLCLVMSISASELAYIQIEKLKEYERSENGSNSNI